MPQLVWWMTNHSLVPSSLKEITRERIASSLARPPALRITCAGVHTGQDGEAAGRREGQFAFGAKRGGVVVVGF